MTTRSRKARTRTTSSAILAAALVLSACGARWEGDDAALNASRSATLDADASATDAAATAAADAATAAAGGTAAGASAKAASAKSRTAATIAPSGATARGVTATSITIGVMASGNINAAAAAFGVAGTTYPDPKQQVEPLVKWINAHGGVAKRQLKIEWHLRDDLSGDTDAAKNQAACTDFVQDKQVFLVTSVYQGHGMAPCLAPAGIPLIESGAGPAHYGIPAYDNLGGYYVTPDQISLSRYTTTLIDNLAARGFFAAGTKVGLVYMGYPYATAAVDHFLKPALARHNVKLVDEQQLRELQRASDFAGTQAEVSNAVLRFKSKGIDRVIGLEDQATTFMASAEQQSYFPRYGLASASLVGAAQAYPKSMLNSTLVGYSIPQDVLPADQGGPSGNDEKVCRQLFLDSGQDPANDLQWGIQRLHCDGFFYIKAVLDRTATLTAKGYVAAVEATGDGYVSMNNYGTHFAPGHYDGVAKGRPLEYVDACKCLRWTGPAFQVP
jgi:hypothetical protein